MSIHILVLNQTKLLGCYYDIYIYIYILLFPQKKKKLLIKEKKIGIFEHLNLDINFI